MENLFQDFIEYDDDSFINDKYKIEKFRPIRGCG